MYGDKEKGTKQFKRETPKTEHRNKKMEGKVKRLEVESVDEYFMKQISETEQKIDVLKWKNSQITKQKKMDMRQIIDLQSVFENCIEEVKKEIYKKKIL